MQHSKLIDDFKNEMWFYIDKSLSAERIKYWDEQIYLHKELRDILAETTDILEVFSNTYDYDLETAKFNKMLDLAASERSFSQYFKTLFQNIEHQMLPRLAFFSILLVASLTVFFLSDNSNSVKTLTTSVLSWDKSNFDDRVVNISTNISMLENENLAKYYFFIQTKDEWDREIYSLNKKIDKLFNESNEYEL